jgi:hypothetical protein
MPPTTHLLQLYSLGDKQELLAAVELDNPDKPTESQVTVTLTTTLTDGALPGRLHRIVAGLFAHLSSL